MTITSWVSQETYSEEQFSVQEVYERVILALKPVQGKEKEGEGQGREETGGEGKGRERTEQDLAEREGGL